jgi:DNA-binding MarR family transcriptional regulator
MSRRGSSQSEENPASPPEPPADARRHVASAGEYLVEDAGQYRALDSPIRQQILAAIGRLSAVDDADGGAGVSIRQLGEELGRDPSSLYRHLRTLVRVGLVDEVGKKASGGRRATSYMLTHERTTLITPDGEGPELDAMCRYIEHLASYAGRETAEAFADRAMKRNDLGRRDTAIFSFRGWLDERQRDEFRELMLTLDKLFADSRRRPGTRQMGATFLFRPTRLPDKSIADEPA